MWGKSHFFRLRSRLHATLAFLSLVAASSLWTSTGGKLMNLQRKLAIATWKPQKDAAMQAVVAVDMTEALRFISEAQERHNVKLTPTLLVGRALAEAMKAMPEINGRIVFGRFVPREQVDVCFLVAVPDKQNLGYTTMRNVPKITLQQMSDELYKKSNDVRKGEDELFKKNMDVVKKLPTVLLGLMLPFTGFLSNTLGIKIDALGLVPHSFGSIVVTSIGMLGYEEAYAPFSSFFHVPAVVTVCSILKKPVAAVNPAGADIVEIRPMMNVCFTVDHRFLGAVEGARFLQRFQHVLQHPHELPLK